MPRTGKGQKIATAGGQEYGAVAEQEEAQATVPLAAAPAPPKPGEAGGFNRPTERPDQPVTAVGQPPQPQTEPDDPQTQCVRIVESHGTKHHCCSDGCADIFRGEPEKYVQALIPPQQVYRGEAGGARDIFEYAKWLNLEKDIWLH